MSVVYVAIGNSDDKLPQVNWAEFQVALYDAVRPLAKQVYGVWHSDATSEYQNACIGAELFNGGLEHLRAALAELARDYQQDSIALAVVGETEFIKATEKQTGVGK